MLQSKHEIGRIEVAIAVPIPIDPVRILGNGVFVLTRLKDADQIRAVEPTVEIDVANLGVHGSDEKYEIVEIYGTTLIQVVLKILHGQSGTEEIDILFVESAVLIEIDIQRSAG